MIGNRWYFCDPGEGVEKMPGRWVGTTKASALSILQDGPKFRLAGHPGAAMANARSMHPGDGADHLKDNLGSTSSHVDMPQNIPTHPLKRQEEDLQVAGLFQNILRGMKDRMIRVRFNE